MLQLGWQLLIGAILLPNVRSNWQSKVVSCCCGRPGSASTAAAIKASQILTRWMRQPCLTRALLAQQLLARIGVSSKVLVGLSAQKKLSQLDSHAWLELDQGNCYWKDQVPRSIVFAKETVRQLEMETKP